MKRLTLLVLVMVLGACSSGTDAVNKDEGGPDVSKEIVADAWSQTDSDTEAEELRDGPETWDLAAPDTTSGEVLPACEGDKGCFLDTCKENADCQSGWCVEHMGEGVCTQHCQEECPPGWLCRQVGASDPDLVFICVSAAANLCKPCEDAAGCETVGGAEDVCVDYGDEGSFCGSACADSDDCPWGFSCQDANTVDGVAVKQCMADAGVCPCTAKSTELGLWTPCENVGAEGTCTGKRVCTADGLSDCDAELPVAESCNGVDDDCDGEVDEPSLVEGEYVSLCDDGNECTSDACAGEGGCSHEALDEGECKDGDSCTVGDHCESGVCVGSQVECDDDNPCTDDTCNGTGGCSFEPNQDACDDGDVCTVADSCEDGVCNGVAVDCDCLADEDCEALEDGDVCNGTLVCDLAVFPHRCVVALETVVSCPEVAPGPNEPCLSSVCDPTTGACSEVSVHDGWACNDGDPCTVGESCLAGACQGGDSANCADGNPCTDDSCQAGQGCVHAPNQAPCDDQNVCTLGDVCSEGTCGAGGQVLVCNDKNQCTQDSCDPAQGCLFVDLAGGCDDGNACTAGEQCSDGACQGGTPVVCDDGNPCTVDSCNPVSGCSYVLSEAPCDDGDICTTGDHCHLGECIGAGTMACNDNNLCTDDSCQSGVGCTFQPNSASCEDGNPCTEDDECANGWCVPGALKDCNDNDPCTDDFCQAEGGCAHVVNQAPCDDGNACTIGDACQNGACLAGIGALLCDDGQFCNGVESCDVELGCVAGPGPVLTDGIECTSDLCDEELDVVVHIAVNVLCDDGEFCNGVESCLAETGCVEGTPPDTDDGLACTLDSCDEEGDTTVHVPDDSLCDDGQDCTADSCDAELGCQFEQVAPCGGAHYVLTGDPNPGTVFNTLAETHFYPNNLVNGIWHGPSNRILVGHAYGDGYWSYDATNGTYSNTPNMSSGSYDRMVFMPQTRVVIHTEDQFNPAPYNKLWAGTIADDGSMSGFVKATFSDGFTGQCNLMSASPDEFMCFTGTAIRHYATSEGSSVLTYDRTTTLAVAPPDQCTSGCYQGTFGWDGKYYYFSSAGSNSGNRNYRVYNVSGVHVGDYTASGSGALSGAYFDWSCGRYVTHDGWGNRSGGNLHVPTDGAANNDSQSYGPSSPYHALQE